MSGRGGGRGRNNLNLTVAELQAMINEHVTAAVAAAQAQWQAMGQVPGGQNGCSYKNFMDCKPHKFSGTEGAVRLLRWIEKIESAFAMCNCPAASQVNYVSGPLEGPALTWWNSKVQILGFEPANAMAWEE
jgi:hypothetical protein